MPKAELRTPDELMGFASWIVAAVVVLASIRGFAIIHLNLSTGLVYTPVAAIALSLALIGYFQRDQFKGHHFTMLKNLIKLNMILGVLNLAIDRVLSVPMELGFVYTFLAPYSVFLLLRMPARFLYGVAVIIALATSYSVCANFIDTLSGPSGVEKVIDYNAKLRPESFSTLRHTDGGLLYRAAGFTGSYHDSANILGIVASFFLVRFVLKKSYFDLACGLISLIGLLLTQSAANIGVAGANIFAFLCYLLIRQRTVSSYVYLGIALFGIVMALALFGDALAVFLKGLGKEGDWEGMLRGIDSNLITSEFGVIFFGHGVAFNAVMTGNEIAHITLTGQLGVLHAFILFWMLLFPVFRFLNVRSYCVDALPTAAAISFGFLSLIHYNSLTKITSVFLFFALYALCLKEINACIKARQMARSVPIPPRSANNPGDANLIPGR